MSLLKAAVQGFSGAAANVSNKYLDEQIAKDRAQFMADLQRTTAGKIREDDFAFKTDPTRVQATRDIAAGDVKAQAGAKRAAELEGWTDTEYQAARDAQTDKDMKADAKRMSLLERAKVRTGGGGGDADPFSKLPPAVRAAYQGLSKQAEQINSAIVKAQADGMWEPDKNKAQSDLLLRQRVLEDKAQDLLKPYIPKPKGQQGASPDDDIRKLLMGEPAGGGAAGAAPAGAPKPPPGPLASMDERTLQRLAAIDGHANQAKAIEELKRRGKWRDKPAQGTPDQGIDYSSAAPV